MHRWIRIGVIIVVVPILLLSGLGIYSFANSELSSNASPLPGIPLVRPVFAQGSTTLPDPDAALSNFVNLNPGSVDFAHLADNVFSPVNQVGDNFMIGTVSLPRVRVRVYIDTDGLIIGYFHSSLRHASVFDWTGWDMNNPGVFINTLEKAMEIVAQGGLGESIVGKPLSWYDWSNPTATQLLIITKGINGRGAPGPILPPEHLFLSIPSVGVTILGTPTLSWRPSGVNLVVTGSDGSSILMGGNPGDLILEFDVLYEFRNSGVSSRFNPLGIVIVYTMP